VKNRSSRPPFSRSDVGPDVAPDVGPLVGPEVGHVGPPSDLTIRKNHSIRPPFSRSDVGPDVARCARCGTTTRVGPEIRTLRRTTSRPRCRAPPLRPNELQNAKKRERVNVMRTSG
jgi:hypothetical protein